MAAATAAGVAVALASGSSAGSAAELAIGLMIAVMRKIPHYDAALKRGEWQSPYGEVLNGKTLGVLGLGKVGRRVATIAKAFGMRVVAWGPTLTQERARAAGAESLPLEKLLSQVDVLSIHLTLSDTSRGLLSEERLRLMKPSAVVINTARGAIVDEAALARMLQQGTIRGAGLDVFTEEPLPASSPLLKLPNVVLTPHAGWVTDGAYETFAEVAVQNILDYLDGKATNILNPEALGRRGDRTRTPK
jgi:phosphoglycerate dehydrogenase-like enzyme